MSTSLGDRIRSMREALGLTQGDLADRIGVASFVSISRWERGVASPRGEHLVSVARVLGTTVEALAGDADHASIVTGAEPVKECA